MSWIEKDLYDSTKTLQFSKQIEILAVHGPLRHFLYRYRGWRIQLVVAGHGQTLDGTAYQGTWIHSYAQEYEHFIQALLRGAWYRIYRVYHNFRYRRYHK